MKTFSPSATLAINAIAKKKKLNGERVYNFAAGDPVLNNHPCITNKAIQLIQKGICPYPPAEGILELRRLAAEWMNANYQTQYSKENVLVTCGGKFAIFAMIYSLLQPNDEALIPAPYWVSYPDIVKMAGGIPKSMITHAENGWKITEKDIRQQITSNSKLLILNNACNPTGILYTREELRALLAIAKEFNLIVISDEVYSGLTYEEPGFISCGSFPEYSERVFVAQSCSKNFGMTGWRIGFAFAPEPIIKQLTIFQGQTTSGTSVVSQWGAIGALENAAEVNAYVKEALKKRRDIFVNTYNSLFQIPIERIQSSIYAFVPLNSLGITSTTDSIAFCERLITSDNIALVPGVAFGMDGYVRFAFSETEKEIYEGLHALKAWTETNAASGLIL